MVCSDCAVRGIHATQICNAVKEGKQIIYCNATAISFIYFHVEHILLLFYQEEHFLSH